MNKTKRLTILIGTFFLLCPMLLAQDGRFDVSLNFAGKLPRQTTGNGVVQSPTSSGGFLGTVGFRIASKVSAEFNFETTSNTQKYQGGGLFYQIPGDMREFSGAILFHPFRHGRWEPFLLGGGGIISFGPDGGEIDGVATPIGAVRQKLPTVLYGIGTDYRIVPRLALRLQYRGLLYQPPDFKVRYLFSGGLAHTAEPTIGFVFNF
ncbi:MAG TPA: hypothetical protein VGG46_15825 [Terriglobales bacterium]|jgi:hypothetical protein